MIARYFGEFNPSRRDTWVFGSRQSGYHLRKFAWTPIVRHRMVAGTASPDDPALTAYWIERRRRNRPVIGKTVQRLLQAQHGRCPICTGLLLHADHEPQHPHEWETWLKAVRTATRHNAIVATETLDTPDDNATRHLVHVHCQRRARRGSGGPALQPARRPPGLA